MALRQPLREKVLEVRMRWPWGVARWRPVERHQGVAPQGPVERMEALLLGGPLQGLTPQPVRKGRAEYVLRISALTIPIAHERLREDLMAHVWAHEEVALAP